MSSSEPPSSCASPSSGSRLSTQPGWRELLQSLSPPSQDAIGAAHQHGSSSARSRPVAAADAKGRGEALPSAKPVLAVLLPHGSEIFAAGAPLTHRSASGTLWLGAIPLEQPSDRQHAAKTDCAVQNALASGADAAARALEWRAASAQRCHPVARQGVVDALARLSEEHLCLALAAGETGLRQQSLGASAEASSDLLAAAACGIGGDAAFRRSSASCALAVFMAELVSQVEVQCAERGLALARLWNVHASMAAETAEAQQAELQHLRAANAAQEAQLMHLRSNQETCQRLRKQLASQSQVADGLRAELRHVTEERDELLPLQNAQTDALVAEALAAAESPA